MKKTLAIFLAAMLLSLAMIPSALAVDEKATAKKGTPVIDGEIDAIWATADKQQLTHVKAGDLKDFAPEVEKAYASALWDESYIYFLFEVTDDDVTNAYGGDPTAQEWKNDTIFLYIDETCLRASASPWETSGNYQFSFCFDGTSKTPRNGASYTKETKSAAKKTDNGFVIEVAFAPEVITLAAGLELGVDYQYNDATEAGTRDYCFGWSDETDTASVNASIWGILKLSDESAAGTASESSVEAPATTPTAPESPVSVTNTPTNAAAPQTSDALIIAFSVLTFISTCGIVVTKKIKI